jgi:zinc protease
MRSKFSLSVRRIVAAASLATLFAACAHTLPEQTMSVVSAEGRLVPLDSATISYDVDNVHVIQRGNYANDAVAVNIYLLGGTRQLTPVTQGVESLLLHAGEYGTLKYPGDAWAAAWALTGSHIVIDPAADWTVFGFRGIQQDFDASWDAFADRLVNPVFSASRIAIVRQRLITERHAEDDDPDSYVMNLADSVVFAGQPYGLKPDGTESTLRGLDSATVARYAATQLVKSRLLVVVVGNISRERLTAAIRRTLGELPEGSYTWTLPAAPPDSPTSVNFSWRVIPTNYVVGMFRGPDISSPSSPAFRVALALLSSEMTQAIRERRGLSYAASAAYVERGATSGMIYVSTSEPRTVLPLISKEMTVVRELPLLGLNLHGFTDSFIIQYFADNMTDAAQADFLARAQLYQGDFHKASETMEQLRHVSPNDVRDAVNKYFRDFHFVYLGDTTQVSRAAFDSVTAQGSFSALIH